MRARRRVLLASIVVLAAGCGSRTALLVPPPDASTDAAPDAARKPDVFVPTEDALPPIDVHLVDVEPNNCPDAAPTLVYVISESNNLYSFYPPTATFTFISAIDCPVTTPGDTPFSMAVDQAGIAYSVFSSGSLFRINTATGACQATSFELGQNALFQTFGMGFSTNTKGTGETLYVASAGPFTDSDLGTIDTTTFKLTDVGAFLPAIASAELTGTGAGDLFAFYAIDANDSAIGQIDKTTANVVGETMLPGVGQGSGWAFGFWGGDFYTFTAPGGAGTVVTRYRPGDGSIVQVGATPDKIVGAGVSTCAPQR